MFKYLLIFLLPLNAFSQQSYIDYQSPYHPIINTRGMVASQNI